MFVEQIQRLIENFRIYFEKINEKGLDYLQIGGLDNFVVR
jgi:hypothetical protein